MIFANSFSDVFKNGFLENFETLSVWQVILSLVVSLILGLFIFLIYRKTFCGVLYSRGLGFSFIMLSLITTLVILAVSSNVVLSLGMVGALSIVRFRSAVKEPMDIAFLFWSISVGIVSGAGLYALAIIGSAIIAIAVLIVANVKLKETPYILVISLEPDYSEDKIKAILNARTKKYQIRSKTISENAADITCEVRLPEGQTGIVAELNRLSYVRSAALVSFNGDYAG